MNSTAISALRFNAACAGASFHLCRPLLGAIFLLFCCPTAWGEGAVPDLAATYRFLVSDRQAEGGALYTATAGALKGRALPLSYMDSAAYWGEFVCAAPDAACAVVDRFNPADYSLSPLPGPAGDLQTERVMVHNGANIYDAAVWQIAVVLGQAAFGLTNPHAPDAYELAGNVNRLLWEGHCGDASVAVRGANRAVTRGKEFRYNGRAVGDARSAYAFRMWGRDWLSDDPFMDTPWERLIRAEGLPAERPEYRRGRISWTDWKPITGENAWAFLLGPLQAAYLHHVRWKGGAFVPLDDPAVGQAMALLPAFAALQSEIGAVYYTIAGPEVDLHGAAVQPRQVSVENNFSVYAGLRVLQATLEAVPEGRQDHRVRAALDTIRIMRHGGRHEDGRTTDGLLHFFRHRAWQEGIFVLGGLANAPDQVDAWVPDTATRAVDANTWGVAALGAGQVDAWFGHGAAFENWQQVKRWGGYGVGRALWGVGYSDRDGNGMTPAGEYRQGILSAEWTAGAITMVRHMYQYYRAAAAGGDRRAGSYAASLARDEQAMLAALVRLRHDRYPSEPFNGRPDGYASLIGTRSKPYLYASRRTLIPFGWNTNPIPSTCATAWAILVAGGYNPFQHGGGHGESPLQVGK